MRRTGKQGEVRQRRQGKRRKKATKARIRAGGTAQAMGKETEQGATRRGRARQAERSAGDGRKTGRRARHKFEAQAARGESRRRGKAQGHERRRKRSVTQEEAGIRRAAGREARCPSLPAPPCRNQRHAPAAPRATCVSASGKKTPARKPAFACGNRAGRIGTSPLAVFQSLREDTGSESAAGRLPARRITPAASPLLSACAASEKERPRPSDSSAE